MKVLIIGLGSIARKHIQVLRELVPDLEIYALRSGKRREEPGIRNLFSYSEIPRSIDFFIISSPTSLHKEAIMRLIRYKKPLFVEKPVFQIIDDDTENILKKISELQLFTYVGCNLRFHPCIRYLKSFIDNYTPWVNEVNVYCGSYLPDWRPGSNYRESYSVLPEMGGGVHLDLIHEFDYIYYIWGKPTNVNSTFRSKSSLGINAIDYANYLLDYPTFTVNLTLNYFRPKAKRTIELVLENKILTVDLIESNINDENGRIIFSEDSNQMKTLKLQMKYFIEAYNNNSVSLNSIEESARILRICLNQ